MIEEIQQIYLCNTCGRGCYAVDLGPNGYCTSCELDYWETRIKERENMEQIKARQLRLVPIAGKWLLTITYEHEHGINHKTFEFDSRSEAEGEMDCIQDEFPDCLTIPANDI